MVEILTLENQQRKAQSKRKSETDAITKEFIKIRAEGGFRLNKVRRLWQKYLEVVELVKLTIVISLLNLLILKTRNAEVYQKSFFLSFMG